MPTSFDKWPVEIKVVKVESNSINQNMDTFFVSGMMNRVQCTSLEEKLAILAKFEVDTDRIVVSTIITRQQLLEVLESTRWLSKSWRGQYQVVMKVFTHESEEALKA